MDVLLGVCSGAGGAHRQLLRCEDDSLFRKLMDGEEERQTIATETRDGSEVLRGDATTPPVQPLMGSEDVVGGANGSTQLPPASFSAGEEDDAPSST